MCSHKCLHPVCRHVHILLENMFTYNLKTCQSFHNVGRHAYTTGCPKRNALTIVWTICPVTSMLDGWNIIHLWGEIHSSFWSTKCLCTISGCRDIKNSKWDIRIKNMDNLLSRNLMPHIVLFIFQFTYVVQKWGLYLKHTKGRMQPLLLKCS